MLLSSQRSEMGANVAAVQGKCYNPHDPTLQFVNRDDDLDFLCEGFTSRRALMSCGHAVTPTSLTNWCRRLLDEGEDRFVCGLPGCDKEWPYAEVCKMALLTPEEREYFETTMASNAAVKHFSNAKPCPGCKSSVLRKKDSDLRVRCKVCTANRGKTYSFCWQCLKEWKGPAPRSDRCENYGCCNESLKTLANCPILTFGSPSIRACPTCGLLLEHDKIRCMFVSCPRCKVLFCFLCLKCHAYTTCPNGAAPRQTTLPVWQKK